VNSWPLGTFTGIKTFEGIKMKVADLVNGLIKTASTDEQKKLQTLKTICNSDSAFVAAVKKYQAHQKLLQKAFLLSRTWQKFGQARTWKITLKALQAALKALVTKFSRLEEFAQLPELLKKQVDKLIKINKDAIPVLA
jgi:ATP phosphoribosyltransferase